MIEQDFFFVTATTGVNHHDSQFIHVCTMQYSVYNTSTVNSIMHCTEQYERTKTVGKASEIFTNFMLITYCSNEGSSVLKTGSVGIWTSCTSMLLYCIQ